MLGIICASILILSFIVLPFMGLALCAKVQSDCDQLAADLRRRS